MCEEIIEIEKQEEATNQNIYTEEELENISGLCSVLQKIHNRLISEGYSISELKAKLQPQLTACYS